MIFTILELRKKKSEEKRIVLLIFDYEIVFFSRFLRFFCIKIIIFLLRKPSVFFAYLYISAVCLHFAPKLCTLLKVRYLVKKFLVLC